MEHLNEFLHLLGDPAHWAFELVADTVFTIVGGITFGRWWQKRHDEKHHGVDNPEKV